VVHSFRTFIAIEIPRDIRQRVIQHIERLRREVPDMRVSWSREDNLHLTLKFLGNVPVANIPKISQAIARATQMALPFEMTVSGCGTFPTRGRPNVLWIGTQATGLPELHAAVEQECETLGFAREPRSFHPHLTIARLRKPEGGQRLAEIHKAMDFAPQSFTVSEVVMFRSELLKEGSKHTAISRHALMRGSGKE
jgi:RNA 2',3'-cyclic 3'-phosphodiesterase